MDSKVLLDIIDTSFANRWMPWLWRCRWQSSSRGKHGQLASSWVYQHCLQTEFTALPHKFTGKQVTESSLSYRAPPHRRGWFEKQKHVYSAVLSRPITHSLLVPKNAIMPSNPAGHQVVVISIAFGVIDTIAVALRLLARWRSNMSFGADDAPSIDSLLPLYVMIVLGHFSWFNTLNVVCSSYWLEKPSK